MNINTYTIRISNKSNLEDMLKYLKSKVELTSKELYYHNMIDIRLQDLYNKKEVKK